MYGVFRQAVLLVAIAAFLGACGEAESGGGADDCTTAACKLATIDTGSPMTDDDAAVAEYQQALDALALFCEDSETLLGDFAVKSQELLENGGQSETLLDILRHVAESIPAGSPKMQSCSSIFAAYVTLRGGKAS
jgi:hypothetical protein